MTSRKFRRPPINMNIRVNPQTATSEGFTLLKQFSSWFEFVEDCKQQSAIARKATRERAHDNNDSDHMSNSGYVTFNQALDRAENGWREGSDRINRLVESLSIGLSNLAEREQYSYDVTGHSLDVGLYLSGEPECWQSPEVLYVEGKASRVIRVVVDMGAHWGISGETLLRKGAMVCALVVLLESQGYRVELIAAKASRRLGNKEKLGLYVTVKHADNVLDLDRVAFAIGHPATNRRLMFAQIEGWTGTLVDTESELMPTSMQGDVYIPWNECLFTDEKRQKEWLVAQLDRLKKA